MLTLVSSNGSASGGAVGMKLCALGSSRLAKSGCWGCS